jgi:hypothetical protein
MKKYGYGRLHSCGVSALARSILKCRILAFDPGVRLNTGVAAYLVGIEGGADFWRSISRMYDHCTIALLNVS